LLGAVDSLLTDVTTIIKKPMQFLKLSTFEERRNISDTLNNIQNNINAPHILCGFLDNLKKDIRPFNIHYTKEMLIKFDNELSELTRKKQEFSKSLDDLNSMVENKGKADEMLISLQEKNTELENYVNTVKKRLAAFLYPKEVLASSIRFFAVFNNSSLSSVNFFNFLLKVSVFTV
jgi:protein subunit release factor A